VGLIYPLSTVVGRLNLRKRRLADSLYMKQCSYGGGGKLASAILASLFSIRVLLHLPVGSEGPELTGKIALQNPEGASGRKISQACPFGILWFSPLGMFVRSNNSRKVPGGNRLSPYKGGVK
jgi:hypothetical protein